MRLEIKALQRNLGITALYVTHDQVEAMTMADRMVVMNAGVAEQIGAPLEVYENPQSRFVAGFIGSPATNFLKPHLIPGRFPSAATIGIRPEHIVLGDAADGKLNATVVHVEALGAETLVHLKLAEGELVTVRQDGSLRKPPPSAPVSVAWNAKDLMVFGEDERRLN